MDISKLTKEEKIQLFMELSTELDITIYGCYGSEGYIEKVYSEDNKGIIIESNICSG